MAKIVSTKFGNRDLVHLPPVNLSGKETPQVRTIAPAYSGGYPGVGPTSIVPKEYAYVPPAGRDSRNQWLGIPEKGYAQGNIVQQERNTSEDGMANQMYSQLVQQANPIGYQDYNQGYPVVPAVSGAPHIQNAQHALLSMAPAQQPVNVPQQVTGQIPPQYPQAQPGQVPQQQQQQQYPGPQNQHFQSPPQEKHIFYGPDGEILPGPPPGFHPGGRRHFTPVRVQDFDVEGQLRFGHLKAVKLCDPMQKFPVFPEYLLRDLKKKYSQYETTYVRIIAQDGEIHVHATPAVPGSALLPPHYMPVYIEEDDFYRGYPYAYSPNAYRTYGTPPLLRLSDRAHVNVPRPPTEDPISELRWRKDDDREDSTIARPVERSYASLRR